MEITSTTVVVDQSISPTLAVETANDPAKAVEFVLRSIGPTTYVGIHPETRTVEAFWSDENSKGAATSWIKSHSRAGLNLYWHLNQPRAGTKKKVAKADIEILRGIAADVDAKNGRTMDEALAAIDALPLPPTIIIMTGGGFQPIWLLRERLPATDENTRRVEAIGKRIAELAAGDAIQNIDRILRVPFTTNFPDTNKRAAGRVECLSGLVQTKSAPIYTLEELEAAFASTTTTVVQFPGTPPAVAAHRSTSLAAAAQANLPAGRRFEDLTTEQQNRWLRLLTTHPEFQKRADLGRDEWMRIVFGFAHAEQCGATEARRIAEAWSQLSSKWNPADFNGAFKVKPGGITVAKLIEIGREIGVPPPWDALVQVDDPTTVVERPPTALSDIPARLEPTAALDLMNATVTFAHNWGGEPLIAHHQTDGGPRPITEEQLKRSLANRRVILPADGEKERTVALADFWLRHPKRREVEKVIFDPEGQWPVPGRVLNLWTGLARQPVKGNCRLINLHIFNVIANRDQACWRYVLRWLAHAVQHPGSAPGTVLVLRSDVEGAGKTFLLEIIARIFGRHAILLNTPEELTGRFNDHLENVCFIGLNEPAFPGDHRAAGKLRSMITDSTWLIEGKFRGARRVPNIAHIALTTNREWAVPAGNKARRFLVLDVNQERAGDHQYFDALWGEADSGGIEAFLRLLLRIPVSGDDLREVPRTGALRRQQLQSADTMTQWAADAVHVGELVLLSPLDTAAKPGNGGFGARLPAKALYNAYAAWCDGMRLRPVSNVEFGRWLGRCGFSCGRNNGTFWNIPDQQAFAEAALRQAGIV